MILQKMKLDFMKIEQNSYYKHISLQFFQRQLNKADYSSRFFYIELVTIECVHGHESCPQFFSHVQLLSSETICLF